MPNMLAPIMFFLSFLALVSAAAIEKRGHFLLPDLVQVSNCKTIAKGTLETGTFHILDAREYVSH